MKKTSSAIIRLVLRKAKPLANGYLPILLRIQFNGRKEKATGQSVPKEAWDAKTETVKKSFPNSGLINKAITDFKNLVIQRKLDFEINNEPYTAAMLLEESKRENYKDKIIFKNIMNDLIAKRGLSRNTAHTYKVMFKNLTDYMGNDNFIINTIDEASMMRFAKRMENEGKEHGSIRTILSKIAAVYNYAIENELADANKYPFKRFKYNDIYPKSNRKQALQKEQVQAFENYFVNNYLITNITSEDIAYKTGVYNKMLHRWTEEFAISVFLFSYYAQGLAFCDIATLKIDQITTTTRIQDDKNINYYIINTYRNKTKRPVQIVIKETTFFEVLFRPYYDTAHLRDNYIFPIFQSNEAEYNYQTDKDFALALLTAERQVNNNIKKIVNKVNIAITEHAKKMQKSVDDLLPTDITFYAMRHSFATAYMSNSNANPIKLATMMGRSPNGIFAYVRELNKVDDIINERKKVFESD